MEEKNSILEKIITSKQTSDITHFNPLEIVSQLLKLISDKEEDILRRRYGLNGKKEETLEEIGRFYQVTRERIRQIENSTIQKIRQAKEFNNLIHSVESMITSLLHQHGGVMEKNYFYTKLLSFIGDTEINKNSVNFITSRLLDSKYKNLSNGDFKSSWQLKSQGIDILKKTIEVILKILNEKGRPLSGEEILQQFRQSDLFKERSEFFTDDVIISYLKVSKKISANPFEDYGLASWGSITPKRINDKIYLIMRKQGQPLHFTKIAELINKAGFDQKKAYPPTVHNELILNKEYVLVGRGIYALKEWGYNPGVVADVLEEILRHEENPLSRDELVKKVLEKRIVKKNTILLALTDKNRFEKLPDGRYRLKNK